MGKARGGVIGLLVAVLMLAGAGVAPVRAAPTTYYVGSTGDTSNTGAATCQSATNTTCTLREAVNRVNGGSGGDTILFNLAAGSTVTLTTGQLTLSKNVTITGPTGGTITVRRDASAGRFRVLDVVNVTASLSNLTMSGGYPPDGEKGGGIRNDGGPLTLTNSTVSGNIGGTGGGIGNDYTGGSVTLIGSTVSGNTAGAGGGLSTGGGEITLTNSTVSGNTADFGGGITHFYLITLIGSTVSGNTAGVGGGIYTDGIVNATNSIVAGNTGSGSGNFGGDGGYGTNTSNLTSGDPLLRPLGSYGGPTQTRPPLPGSPAVDGGSMTCSDDPATGMPLVTDQRGTTRPQGTRCDIGAVEYVPLSPLLGGVPHVGTAGQAVTVTGLGFQRNTMVTVDGVAATGITVNADGTRLTLTLPPHAPGAVPLVVTNPGMGNTVMTFILYAVPNAVPTPHATVTPNATRPAPNAPARTPGATAAAGTPTPLPAPTRR